MATTRYERANAGRCGLSVDRPDGRADASGSRSEVHGVTFNIICLGTGGGKFRCANLSPFQDVTQYSFATLKPGKRNSCHDVAQSNVCASQRCRQFAWYYFAEQCNDL